MHGLFLVAAAIGAALYYVMALSFLVGVAFLIAEHGLEGAWAPDPRFSASLCHHFIATCHLIQFQDMVRMDCALVLPSQAEVPARPDCLHACCSAWLGARTNGLYFISPCLPDVSRGHSKRWKWAVSASGNL